MIRANVIAFIFAFLLAFNVIQIGFGGVLLNDFAGKTPELALLVGGFTGIAFEKVIELIYSVKPQTKENPH